MGQQFRVDSESTFGNAVKWLRGIWEQHGCVTLIPKIHNNTQCSQFELYEEWVKELTAHLLKKKVHLLAINELEGAQKSIVNRFYQDTGAGWVLVEHVDPINFGRKTKALKKPEHFNDDQIFELLTWIKGFAEFRGLTLEPKGEYAKLIEEKAA